MDDRIKEFILNNMDLIDSNDKDSWELFYQRVSDRFRAKDVGEITSMLLQAGIDPMRSLQNIPNNYLFESHITDYEIYPWVQSIGNSAFQRCESLTKIEIPSNVIVIKDIAFLGCSELSEIHFPKFMASIGRYAFASTAISNIILPDTVGFLGSNLFANCDNLQTVKLPQNINEISDECFRECKNLHSITLPETVSRIGHYAFQNCISLKNLTIPKSVIDFGTGVFYGCTELTELTYLGSIKEFKKTKFFTNKNPKFGSSVTKVICIDGELENF